MKTIKRIFIFLLALITVTLIHYYLPQRDIVQVVNTDVKRMDISKGSPFWDRPDAGTDKQETRDVRFIYTVNDKDKTRVYRNEDTGWSFPFYLKFDSSDLSAKAQNLANKDDTWVAVTHYGWRIRLFSIFPNATKVKQVKGPDVFLIPWFNIVFLGSIFLFLFWIWLLIRDWKKRKVDPITDKIGDELDEIGETVGGHAKEAQKDIKEARSGLRKFMKRWFGSK
ncbi:MAG: DUF1523 family protein [Hellea sp.]